MSEDIEELRDEAERIYQSCQSWKKCNDGSYEMALTHRGYYKILSKIERLKDKE